MRTLIIGDLHHGEKGDHPKHNQQISDFIDHVCNEHRDVDMVIQLGDWWHHRNKIQVATLNRGIENAEKLKDAFGKENVYVLTGNHDVPMRDSLEDSSLAAIEHLVTVVDEPLSIGDYYLSPWINTTEQWDNVVEQGQHHKYLFAHLELNGFAMNDHHIMEHGFNPRELRDYDAVITGHYHSPQKKDNIQYTGIPFPVSQSEANRDMGYWILDGDDLQFIVYDRVKVISVSYSDLADVLPTVDPESTSIRVVFDEDLDDESIIDATSELLMEMNFSEVKVKYTGNTAKRLIEAEADSIEEIENIDAKVIEFLNKSSDVVGVDRTRLSSLYSIAKERELCD